MTDQTDGWSERARKCAVGIRWRLVFLVSLPLILYTAIYNVVWFFHERNFGEVLNNLVSWIFLAIVASFVAARWLRDEILANESSRRQFIAITEAQLQKSWTNPLRLSLLACSAISVSLLLVHAIKALVSGFFGNPEDSTVAIITVVVAFVLAFPTCYFVAERLIRNVKQSLREVMTLSGE